MRYFEYNIEISTFFIYFHFLKKKVGEILEKGHF